MLKKKLLAIGVGVALSVSAIASTSLSSDVQSGLTLTSNIGTVDVYCNGKEGPKTITSSPLNLAYIWIMGIFGSTNLSCTFYPDGVTPTPGSHKNEIGSATLALTLTRAEISNVKTYNGHAMPAIAYLGTDNGSGYKGISVTLNS